MKKLLSIPIIALMLSFTVNNSIKITVGAVTAYELTREVKAQSRNLTLDDTVMFKPSRYVPTMQTFGFNVGFDGTGIYYPAARPDYRFDIDVIPNLASVAISNDYRDLYWAPDFNNLPLYWHKWESDTLYAAARSTTNSIAAITASMATKLSSEVDGSVTNEIQSLSLSGQSVSISGGNTIVIPTQTTGIVSDKTVTITSTNTLLTTGGTYPNLTIGLNMIGRYTNTVNVAGGAGASVFYLTDTKAVGGNALYTNITYVGPVVNDINANYTYGWTYNSTTKALTVTAKSATPTGVIALLGISLLGAPVTVANGTPIIVLVEGN